MRTCAIATALVIAALCSSRAQAQSRVSVELGGIVSAYDVQSAPGATASRLIGSRSFQRARSSLRFTPTSSSSR